MQLQSRNNSSWGPKWNAHVLHAGCVGQACHFATPQSPAVCIYIYFGFDF